MPDNATLLQGFEWNCPADKKHFKRLLKALPGLKAAGIDNVWLPPACKAASQEGNGYDIYDLYDLGEFDQKGGVGTKWGTKDDLMALSKKAEELGVGLYWDAVLNHKAGADKKEKAQAVEVDTNDRNKVISDSYEISAWLGFDFPGRGEKYSKQKYHWYHFSGTDYNAANEKSAIYQIQGDGKGWSATVDDEDGNADYMMFADLDYRHPEVIEDVKNWGEWITNEVKLKVSAWTLCSISRSASPTSGWTMSEISAAGIPSWSANFGRATSVQCQRFVYQWTRASSEHELTISTVVGRYEPQVLPL